MSAPQNTSPSVPPAGVEVNASHLPAREAGLGLPPVAEPGRPTQIGTAGPVNAESPAPGRPTLDAAELNVLRDEKYYELLHEDAGHAGLSLVLPALFAGTLVLIAAVSGKLGYLVEHLPLTERPNGFVLLVLLACGAVYAGHRLLNTADVLPGIDPDPRWDKRLATDADEDPGDKWPVRS